MALLLPNPHAKQAEFLSDTHRYKVLNWGRRTGKSVAVWEKVVLEGMLRQGRTISLPQHINRQSQSTGVIFVRRIRVTL